MKSINSSFLCTMDSIAEAVKVLEEVIKTMKGSNMSIGINCNGSELYNAGTKKYEMEGAKALFDTTQMIDFYVKFLADHPLVTYLEDPMSNEDLPGWRAFIVYI